MDITNPLEEYLNLIGYDFDKLPSLVQKFFNLSPEDQAKVPAATRFSYWKAAVHTIDLGLSMSMRYAKEADKICYTFHLDARRVKKAFLMMSDFGITEERSLTPEYDSKNQMLGAWVSLKIKCMYSGVLLKSIDDFGKVSQFEPQKSAETDAAKRCIVQLGFGLDLYNAPVLYWRLQVSQGNLVVLPKEHQADISLWQDAVKNAFYKLFREGVFKNKSAGFYVYFKKDETTNKLRVAGAWQGTDTARLLIFVAENKKDESGNDFLEFKPYVPPPVPPPTEQKVDSKPASQEQTLEEKFKTSFLSLYEKEVANPYGGQFREKTIKGLKTLEKKNSLEEKEIQKEDIITIVHSVSSNQFCFIWKNNGQKYAIVESGVKTLMQMFLDKKITTLEVFVI